MVTETYTKQEIVSYNYIYSNVAYQIRPDGAVIGSKTPNTTRGTSFVKVNSFNGSKNPRWRAQIKAGVNATTSADGQKHIMKLSPFSAEISFILWDPNSPSFVYKHYYSNYGYIPYSSSSTIASAPAELTASVRNRAIRKFINKCNDARSSIEGGQDLYELRETLNSIRHPVASLRKFTTLYASKVLRMKTSRSLRDAAGLRGLSNAITDTYLEYNFGISPTVSDIAKLIADAGRSRFSAVPISANASEEFAGTTVAEAPVLPPFMTYSMNKTTKSKLSIRYKGAIRTGVDAEGHISAAQALRLTPDGFLPTVWSILPYSWMLDYIANIGDIIEALSFVNSNVAWGCVTTRTENSVTYSGNGLPSYTGLINDASHRFQILNLNASGGNSVFKSTSFVRANLVGSDLVPTFEIKVPTTVKPYLNSFAVLVQHLWGRSRN
jgi:hypothetical protein